MVTDRTYRPVLSDVAVNTPESNEVLDHLVTGEIKVLRLFDCDMALFEALREEAFALIDARDGQPVDENHPTTIYVRKFDRTWQVKPGTIHQYSLYNSKDDLLFNDEDHHRMERDRRFSSRLHAVQEFMRRYLPTAALQNFRMQSIMGGGDLGQHREKIVGIPGREQQFKLRFHPPVVTNPGVWFLMDGQPFRMEAGSVYLFNQACMHGVTNEGNELRIHHVFDCYLDDHIVCDLIGRAWRTTVH